MASQRACNTETSLQQRGAVAPQDEHGVYAHSSQPALVSSTEFRDQAANGHSNDSDYGTGANAVPRKRRHGSSAGRDGSESAERGEQHRRHANGAAAFTSADARAVWVQSKRADVALSWADLTEVFSHFGYVRQVDVPAPHAGKLPFAFVHFDSEQAAQLILQRAAKGEFEHVTVRVYRARGHQAARTGVA